MKLDQAQKGNLLFARVLVEVYIDQPFPEIIKFRNEHGHIVEQTIFYAWKTIKCTSCTGFGHRQVQCHKPKKTHKVQ